jgi:hypothetical protein
VYQFFKSAFGVDLVAQNPRPQVWFKDRFYLAGSVRAFSKAKHLSLKAQLKIIPGLVTELVTGPPKYFYPSKGAFALVEPILSKAKNLGIKIELNTRARLLELSKANNKVIVERSDGRLIEARHSVLTSASAIDKVKTDFGFNPKRLKLKAAKGWHHLHLLIDNYDARLFSYIKFIDHPIFARVSDLTPYIEGIAAQHRVFCMQFHQQHVFSENNISELYVRELRRLGIVFESKQILQSRHSVYDNTSFVRGRVETNELANQLRPLVTVLDSKALSPNCTYYIDRWLEVLSAKN